MEQWPKMAIWPQNPKVINYLINYNHSLINVFTDKGTVGSPAGFPTLDTLHKMSETLLKLNNDLHRKENVLGAATAKLMSGNLTENDLDNLQDVAETMTESLKKLMGPLAKTNAALGTA